MEPLERSSRGSGDTSMPSRAREEPDPELAERYERYVLKAKDHARNGNLQKSIEYFQKANSIHPSEKLKGRIAKLEEALEQLNLQNEQDDEFIDVLGSGFLLFKDLYNKLFEHQKEGVAFLYSLYRDGRKGGILADDMGLGKTIQVIAFLSGMFDSELTKSVLLVMPTTLISNWVKEFEKWTPGMRVSEFHGVSKKERTRNLEKIQRKSGVLITTYQMLINNWQQLATYNGKEFVWDYIILDEAHKIKTSSTKTAKSCAALPSKNRVLLTGTPIQNNLREMWALYDFACQGTLLGTAKTFKMEYENPITRAREKDATPGEKALGLKISENLMKIIQPYFLRRTKSDVQQKKKSQQALSEANEKVPTMPSLTRKNDLIIWVYLSPIQEEVYRKFISLDQIKELLMTTRSPLAELTILKKLCDHPRLLSARACIQLGLEGDDVEDGGEVEVVTKFDHLSDDTLIEESGKLDLLIQLLHRLKEEGHRTLVFSQSRKMLDMVDRILNNRGFKVMRIDGTVSLPDREKRIGLFQNNIMYSVLLLTTQVGGVGLTLTSADRVVIFDPSWNPATDAQAVDRAYRIGQQANVVIYRLITCGTVEEKIYRRQIFKDSLIRQTTGDKKNPFRYFSKQELKELFSLDDTRTSTTQIQLQNMHSAQRKTDSGLDEHIAYLHTLPIFGISDHDLIYSHEVSSHEEDEIDNEHEVHYIHERVQKAHELVQMESQMNKQLMDQIRNSTEGAWLRQPTIPEKPKPRSLPNLKPVVSPPMTIDLTEAEIGDVSVQMNSLLIEDSAAEEDHSPIVQIVSKPPDLVNGSVEDVVIVDSSEENRSVPFIKKEVLEDVNCQMTSLIVGDSDEEENLPPAPFQYPSLKEESLQRNSFTTEYNHNLPPVLQSDSPAQDVIGGVSNGHSVTENFATRISPGSRTSLTHNPDSPAPNPLAGPISNTGPMEPACNMGEGLSFAEESSLPLSKSRLPCDFNLVLEDSMDKSDLCDATADMDSVMEASVANEEPMLVLDESNEDMSQECGDLEYSMKHDMKNVSATMVKSLPRLEHSPSDVVQGECEMNGIESSPSSDDEAEEEENVFHTVKRKAVRRISSESEADNSIFINDDNDGVFSPFGSPKTISSSTPKVVKSLSDKLFSHRDKPVRRRSIASRRSLIEVAVEEATDVQESIVDSGAESSEEEEELLVDEAEEAEGEEHEVTEEEPAGETLPPEESKLTSGEDYESDSFIVKSSSYEESIEEESTGEVELLSDEQVDCLAQDTKATVPKVVSHDDDYSALVQRGKELKESGRVKEALDCFLKALDIKSGDPEVMMITLSLYRNLS